MALLYLDLQLLISVHNCAVVVLHSVCVCVKQIMFVCVFCFQVRIENKSYVIKLFLLLLVCTNVYIHYTYVFVSELELKANVVIISKMVR